MVRSKLLFYILTLLSFFSLQLVNAQTISYAPPEFEGGLNALEAFVTNNIIYPAVAENHNIQGTVVVGFTVVSSGRLMDIHLESEIGYGTTDAVLKGFMNSPAWKPAVMNGLKVNRYVELAIDFKLIAAKQGTVTLGKQTVIWKRWKETKSTGYYLDNNMWTRGDPADTALKSNYYRVVSYPDSASADGLFLINDFYPNKKPKLIGKAITNSPNTVFEGSCISFYENGKRSGICTYHNNELVGDQVLYYPSGKLYAQKYYPVIGRIKLVKCIDTTGITIADNGQGNWGNYDQDTQRATLRGAVADSLPVGTWVARINDTLNVKMDFKDGEVVKGEAIAASGKIYSLQMK